MRILVLCEGNDEEVIINFLIDNNRLSFSRDDLIGQRPYAARSLSYPDVRDGLLEYGREVEVYRVGDTQKDKLTIPRELNQIVKPEKIYKICTKPELEILFIINEGLLDDYTKSKLKASTFAKTHIKLNGLKYSKNTQFIKEYLTYYGIEKLIECIYEYKRIKKKTHESDEKFLADYVVKKR